MEEDNLTKEFLHRIINADAYCSDIGAIIATADENIMREFISLSKDQQVTWIGNHKQAAREILSNGEYFDDGCPLLTIWNWEDMPEQYKYLFDDIDAEFLVRFYSIDEIDGDELYYKYRVVEQDEFDGYILLAVDKRE